MMSLTQEQNEFDRYLSLLRISQGDPTLGYLERLVTAHMRQIPFENISKLFYWKTMGFHASIDLTQYLNGIEHFHFGGTCYANAFHLNELLCYLGYDARLCGADMKNPDVHLVNVVTIDAREYLVDVGYAAPFLEPIPLDLTVEHSLRFGNTTYLIRPRDGFGRTRVELYRNGILRHGYIINPAPRRIDEFLPVIAESFAPNATFMNALLLVKFGPDESSVIHNKELIQVRRDDTNRTILRSNGELASVVHELFGIPEEVVAMAVNGKNFGGDAWN